jgi:hypothetical protein
MPTVEERLASLEARVDATGDLKSLMTDLRADTNRQFVELREDLNRRFEALDQKGDRHFLYLDQKIDRQFTWIVGTQLALLLAVVGALAGAYYR